MPAGFWIAWECGLASKREVLKIAKALGVTARDAAASCMEVWEWAESQTDNGTISGIDFEDVSAAVRIPGIGEAMAEVGWLTNGDGSVHFPKWERFNSKSAKKRMRDRERQAAFRLSRQQRDTCHA